MSKEMEKRICFVKMASTTEYIHKIKERIENERKKKKV